MFYLKSASLKIDKWEEMTGPLLFLRVKQKIRNDSLEKILILGKIEGKRRGWHRMRWSYNITNSIDVIFEQTLGDRGRQRSLVCCSVWGCKELNTT